MMICNMVMIYPLGMTESWLYLYVMWYGGGGSLSTFL